jgi:hypothetical protein
VHAVSVVFDLVKPFWALQSFVHQCAELWLDPLWKTRRIAFRPVTHRFWHHLHESVGIYIGDAYRRIDNATGELERDLRLSLVSCPIYLSPATARTKSIRLHQVWQPPPAGEPDEQPDRERGRDLPDLRASGPHSDQVEDRTEPVGSVSRITLRPHDPTTGEEVEKDEVVRGYEYQRGQYVTFTPDELKALDLESSKVIDLEMFVPRGDVDAVYFNSPYYLYPDGQMAVEAVRVIGAAMDEASVVGIGRLTMSRRERMVMVEPHGSGMVLITLRAADEVRGP